MRQEESPPPRTVPRPGSSSAVRTKGSDSDCRMICTKDASSPSSQGHHHARAANPTGIRNSCSIRYMSFHPLSLTGQPKLTRIITASSLWRINSSGVANRLLNACGSGKLGTLEGRQGCLHCCDCGIGIMCYGPWLVGSQKTCSIWCDSPQEAGAPETTSIMRSGDCEVCKWRQLLAGESTQQSVPVEAKYAAAGVIVLTLVYFLYRCLSAPAAPRFSCPCCQLERPTATEEAHDHEYIPLIKDKSRALI